MSEPLQSTYGSSRQRTPIAEFQRWLIIACVVPVAGTSLLLSAERIPIRIDSQISFIVIWATASACEGWLQFCGRTRRLLWTLGGALMGWLIVSYARGSQGIGFAAWVFAIPAAVEIFAARGVRHRPWAWLIGTLALYGSLPAWSEFVARAARYVTRLVFDFLGLPMTTQRRVVGFTTILFVVLIIRAIVGSFIASRKTV